MIRPTFDANVAITILDFVPLMMLSIDSPTLFSEIANHGLSAPRESQIYSLTPSVPIRAIFERSAGLSIAGV